MASYAIDWDGTLVDTATQEWLPGALAQLRRHLADGDTVFVHSARASYPEGHAMITGKLRTARLDGAVVVHAKPLADVYVDDRAQRPDEWLTGARAAPSPVRPRRKHAAGSPFPLIVDLRPPKRLL